MDKMFRVARTIYTSAAWLFVVGVLLQVFLAGMVVVARQLSWTNHISVGHFLAVPLLFMLVTMYLGRFPRPIKTQTWVLFGVYVIQADILIFLRLTAPLLSALHPVLALVDFALCYALARQAMTISREEKTLVAAPEKLKTSSIS